MLSAPLFAAFSDEFVKTSVTRAALEARKAMAAGDVAGAQQIGQAYGQLGLKPRYVKDISLGGQEAGVDLMMGSSAPQQAAAPATAGQRLEQYKGRKAALGLEGRRPGASVMHSPAGRQALIGGAPAAASVSPEAPSGLMARKMYKPDSPISRGEFTAETVRQKKQITDTLRGMGPEQRAMLPRMSGPVAAGGAAEGSPLQRTVSYADYVPGMQDIRKGPGGAPRAPSSVAKDVSSIKETVLDPMKQKGQAIMDVASRQGTNYGNIARTSEGLKVVDFLPGPKAGTTSTPMTESMRAHGVTGKTRSVFGAAGEGLSPAEETKRLGQLRKETFKPTMQITPKGQAPALSVSAQIPAGAGGGIATKEMATGAAIPKAKLRAPAALPKLRAGGRVGKALSLAAKAL